MPVNDRKKTRRGRTRARLLHTIVIVTTFARSGYLRRALAGEGKTSAEIAKLVHLPEGTVRDYLSEAISKLNAGNRIEAFRMARNAGWL
jgi:hypothetical protein